jgi:hypothetical protein
LADLPPPPGSGSGSESGSASRFLAGSGSASKQCGSKAVLRIRDVYPRSDFFPSRIPDPNCLHPGSASKNLSILTPKKWFLSSRKYDPGCSSRIPDPDADFLPIPDPGTRGQKGTGSRIRIRNTDPQPWAQQSKDCCLIYN